MATLPAIDKLNTEAANPQPIDTKLEVIVIPVADVDRSKRFYEQLGWRLDADFVFTDDFRVVHMTPPGSTCSVLFGKGVTPAAPGSAHGFLVVSSAEQARAELARLGADVSEVFHFEAGLHVSGTKGRISGPDPKGRSYFTFTYFRDPDGNGWLVQEVKARIPGRGFSPDVASLTAVLRQAEEHHGAYVANAPKHHWSDWYAAYIVACECGKAPEDAIQAAGQHMKTLL